MFSLWVVFIYGHVFVFCSIIGLETNSIQTMLMAQGATTASNALSKTPVLQALQQQSQTNLHVSNYSFGSLCSRGFLVSIKILQTNFVQTMLMAKGEKTNSNAFPKHHVFEALHQQNLTKLSSRHCRKKHSCWGSLCYGVIFCQGAPC